MRDQLERCLEDLENRIDAATEEALEADWRAFTEGRFRGPLFSPRRQTLSPPRVEWPRISINAALEDPDAMLLRELGACSGLLASGSGLMLHVRANYGTSILPLLFGVKPFVMDEALDTLPTSEPLNDVDAIRRLLDAGEPDVRGGYGERVLAMAERFLEAGRRYPRIGRYVWVYHPDLQGPLDVCEVVWGSTLFLALYDVPDLVHGFLERITQTYEAFMQAWIATVPFRSGANVHWGFMHAGCLMLRMDSATNLSPALYREFSRPYDQRLLSRFGGGATHFCGKGDHLIGEIGRLQGLSALNLSQPHLNDMERVFAHTVDRDINILGLERQAAEDAVRRGRDLRGRVHCA